MKYGMAIFLCAALMLVHPQVIQAMPADFDGNGKVDFVDFLLFARAFGSTDASFDMNGDGRVDFLDFLMFVREYGKDNPDPEGPPDPDTLLDTLYRDHPRLMLNDDQLDALKTRWRTDPALQKVVGDALSRAIALRSRPPLRYQVVGPRLLAVSRDALDRIYHFGLAWRWTGYREYLIAGRDVLLTVVGFPDWNPSHFLDVAEMAHAVGIGYDWFFHDLDESDRGAIRAGLIRHGLQPGVNAYYGTRPAWWVRSAFNWNQVCNGGLTVAALAIAETDPEYAKKIIPKVVESLPLALNTYEPDGAWGEGPGYWNYATTYTAYGLAAMQSALGTAFGLTHLRGLAEAGYFPVHSAGSTDLYFNYADAGERARRTPMACNFWLASTYGDAFIAAAEHDLIQTQRASAQHVMWYVPRPDVALDPERDRMFRGEVEVAFMRSDWPDANAVFVGIKAGYNQVAHGHLDLGNFVMDALGERWAIDLGAEDYDLPGYWEGKAGGQRWTYYRLNSESHNVPLINGKSQHPNGTSKLVKFRSSGAFPFAVVDLSQAYLQNVSGRIMRGVALVNDRQDALIQDEFDLNQMSYIEWGMTTPAKIDLQNDGTAILTKNEKQLRAMILSPPGFQFGMGSAEQAPPQRPNTGINRLVIRLPFDMSGPLRVAVLLSPVRSADADLIEVKPIAEW